MGRLDGQVAVVTGGARGMGASHVRGLVAEGARVVVADVLEDEGRALAAELGDRCLSLRLDVTDEGSWDALVAATEQRFGPIDVLVNNAGVVAFKAVESTTPEEFRRVLDVNLVGTYIGVRAALPSLRRAGGGVIVNVSSTAGMIGYAYESAYVASKWGVRGLTKALALELAADGIRVVSVHPGAVRTPMTAGLADDAFSARAIPRIGEPEEVTRMVLFLVSEASYSTGSEFVVDGGAVLGPIVPVPREDA